jgi:phospholipase D1/2
MVGDVKVENQIGDAIVERAVRAHHEGTPWRCCIMIPLLPGFTFPVDHSDASAVSGCVSFPISSRLIDLLDPDHP